MRSQVSTRKASLRSRPRVAPCSGGPPATTTSAGSAPGGEPERRPTRDGAELCTTFGRKAERDPTDIAADGATRVLVHGAAGGRLRIDLAALEAAHALEHRERRRLRCDGFHRDVDA